MYLKPKHMIHQLIFVQPIFIKLVKLQIQLNLSSMFYINQKLLVIPCNHGTQSLKYTLLIFLWQELKITSKFGELWSPARQQICPCSRSKVKVTTCCQLKGPVTRIMHAKYQCSIINTSEDMSQVKVFVTDRGTDGRTDEWDLMSPAFAKGRGQKYHNLQRF